MRLRHHTFAIGLVVAAAATLGLYRVVEAPKASHRVARTPVVIARYDIPEGHSIDGSSVIIAQWPGTVPFGAYSAVDSVIGRVARVAIFKGEVVMPNRLAEAQVNREPRRQPPLINYLSSADISQRGVRSPRPR
jgi:Flp pilus assembly protein CpaB